MVLLPSLAFSKLNCNSIQGVKGSGTKQATSLNRVRADLLNLMAGTRRGLESLLCLPSVSFTVKHALDCVPGGDMISNPEVVERLLKAGLDEYEAICLATNDLRKAYLDLAVSFAVNSNMQFTNSCM
ncbi:hypothetical protein FVE85_3401 [Porphyridium purpureum]|uniref:Uncharacterized protein n=1 Tax=Porphyridium purpureum TaxID=35688 RepID=A0A5J4YW60_PORPP|nr:hypothetical protein FVE85_3401 [Porphyridium purpureum]|eukprot:POR9543..scf227_4